MSVDENNIASPADLRPVTAADVEPIMRMMEAFNVFEGIAFSPERLRESFATLLAHPEWGAMHMAEVGGVPAGYAVLTYGFDFEYGGRDAFLTELFVVERFRNMGVGRALMAHVESFAKDHGVGALHLIVRPDNGRAQVIYRHDGFNFDPRLLMTKRLE